MKSTPFIGKMLSVFLGMVAVVVVIFGAIYLSIENLSTQQLIGHDFISTGKDANVVYGDGYMSDQDALDLYGPALNLHNGK